MRQALATFALTFTALAQTPDFTGNWQGTLDAGAARLRLGLHVTRNPAGEYASTLDSIDQGALALPVAVTQAAGTTLHLELPNLRATFDGTLDSTGTAITGTFSQGLLLPLVLRRVEQVETLRRAQLPAPPFPYTSEEVTYQNAQGKLAGTLTKPKEAGPFPAVLLITGSGPQDRDETIAGHKPFLILADYLARRGFAVLRVDDRGVGGSAGKSTGQTLDQMAQDVTTGLQFLQARKEIDAAHIGLLGHSAGAVVGPLAASRTSGVAFLVMLAGPGVTGEEVVRLQASLILRSLGTPENVVERNRKEQDAMLAILKSEPDPKAAAEKIRAAVGKLRESLSDAQRRQGEQPLEAQIAQAVSAEFRSFLAHDPAAILKKISVPVLALNGSRDLQVPPAQNLPPIAAALASGGNADFTVAELPGLNHTFQQCVVCTLAEYGSLEQTISPAVLETIGDWLTRHTRPDPAGNPNLTGK